MKLPEPKKLESGKWYMQVMIDGKRKSKAFDTKEDALYWAAGLKTKSIEDSKAPRQLTFGEAVDRYIESKSVVLSPSTIAGYKIIRKNQMGDILNVKLPDLTAEKVQRWVNSLAKTKTPKTVANAHGLLTATLAVYKPDMMLRTTLPQKQKKEIQIPSIDEIKLLHGYFKGKPMELPFLLAVCMGLRTSEIRGLTWDCIKDDTLHVRQALVRDADGNDTLKATKTYSGDRKLHIPSYIMELFNSTPKNSEFIIKCNRNKLYKNLHYACDKIGIPKYRFHDLRHLQASVMLSLGVPDKYAMERMGHATPNMLKSVYQHTMTSKTNEVAETVENFFSDALQICPSKKAEQKQ